MQHRDLPFVKMHGIGNDFVVLGPAVASQERDWSKLAIAMCDRRFGIGSDGLLLVEEGTDTDFRMRMFNPDGSEAEMCGNGIRCFAKYTYDHALARRTDMSIATGAGIQYVHLLENGGTVDAIEVTMGVPEFRASQVPVLADTEEVVDRPLEIEGVTLALSCVSMGNPHAVAFVNDIAAFPLERIGPQVEHHPWFPRRTNFEICQIVDREHVVMRVWERGAGITLACGTGACGVMAVARRHGYVEPVVDMRLPGGHLRLAWDGSGPIMMTGPAAVVYEGVWPL